ncbi:MAG TPA: radical SAM protein [Byssovorax sp.]|jgi:radical SAM superfamily enzyme YgiQ (UPF0313 family)
MPWVALVGPELEENLSLRYLASSLTAAGFDSEILPFSREHEFGPAIARVVSAPEPPVVVGVSLAFQWRASDFLAFAAALRELGYRGHVTMGGHFATFAAHDLLRAFPEIDSVVRQEAEETMVALTRALVDGGDLGRIPGLALRDAAGEPFSTAQPALPDLATLPWPDRRGAPAASFGHAVAPLVASRGCYANCSFCCIAAWHEQSLPGKRYRVRDVAAVADEMAALQRERGVEIFIFHDDNFFVPGHRRNLERFGALADALEARGVTRFATVVKTRPTDVDPAVFRVLKERLQCIRCYVGVESDADQGLETLRRWSPARENREAFEVVRALELYTCFNMLVFDPDTTIESLRTNLAFMRFAAEYPSNFGRVELYAGTPLLERMQGEGRCTGDFLQWDYTLASPEVDRIFELTMQCFHARNFAEDALANRVMGVRFDVEIAKHFHPGAFRRGWLDEGKALTRALALDGVAAFERVVDHVERGAPRAADGALIDEVAAGLRRVEAEIGARCDALEDAMQAGLGVGRDAPLPKRARGARDSGATPLQTARTAAGALR